MKETQTPQVLLEHYLKRLKLPSMLKGYKSIAELCAQERADYTTFLLRLAERELLDREQRAAERRIKAAGFPVLKTLDIFDFAAQPSLNEARVRELIRGEYIDEKENVLLVGNPGTGKSHLATCREERSLHRFHKQLERQHLIILDELGFVPFSKAGAELLFDVVSRAYERISLLVTTNLPFEQWTEILGSERLTGALLDRLTHRVHILEANGESYRLREAKMRIKRRSPRKTKET
jgi:DNA replication protein DnaC